MRTPPLSGPALHALVAAVESPLTGDVMMELMRKESTIAEMMDVPAEPGDEYPLDQRVVASPPRLAGDGAGGAP